MTRKPSAAAVRIKRRAAALGATQVQLSFLTCVSPFTISRALGGRGRPFTAAEARLLEAALTTLERAHADALTRVGIAS